MQNVSWILPEKPCWLDSSETEFANDCFIKGEIQSLPTPAMKISLSYKSHNNISKTFEIPISKIFEINEDAPVLGIEDMVNLPCFNEPELLANLKIRYKNDIIFTYIGPTLLIINPYKILPIDFSSETIQKYKAYTMKTEKFLLNENPPHIFANAGLAYRQLFEQNRNQAMIISGESGAGKTESVKYMMKFIAALSSTETEKLQKNEMPIEDKIVNCSLILEAFGNAKTIRNYNSSRFGKYVRIWMLKNTKKIKEADIINYLLEKSRVCMQSIGERNYHIFYHFLRGASSDLLDEFSLTKDLKYYDYLNKSGCYDAENIDDVGLFHGVCECLDQMKFSKEEVNAIWSVLAAILKLGNLEFDDAKKTDTNPCKIINEPLFGQISNLLKIDKEVLRSALTIKTRITDKEKFLCPLEKNECFSVRDSFSKCLYDKVFNRMIKRLNSAIRNHEGEATSTSPNKCLSIGLLDIFGFEDFKINSLEQFCINFTNEKLQQLYINYIFKSEKKEFINEGLENFLGQITYQDNQPIIDLFDKPPFGIFLLLDESTTLKSSEDKRLLETIVKTHKENQHFKAPKSVIETFIISHSAKNVEYNIIGFRKKNKDEINLEIEDAFINTKDPEIYNIFMGEWSDNYKPMEESKECLIGSPKRTGKSMGGQDKFLGTKFRTQMRSLMDELMNCDAHFVRCLKPNEVKKNDFLVPLTILSQIRYLGLLDSIKVRKNTFPARKEFKDFFRKYQTLLRSKGCKDYSKEIKNQEFKYLSEEIIKIALGSLANQSEVLFGKTKIYLKAETEDKIDKIFLKMWKLKRENAEKILKQYLVFKFRSNVLLELGILSRRMRKFKKIQAIFKGKIQRRKFLQKKKAIQKLTKLMKTQFLKNVRKKFEKLKKTCEEIKKWQLKKKAAGQFYLLRLKVMKTQMVYFSKKYQNSCKLKSKALTQNKKEKEEKINISLEKMSNFMTKLMRKTKRKNLDLFKKQCDLKKQFLLELNRKEEEKIQEKLEKSMRKVDLLNPSVQKKVSEEFRQKGKSVSGRESYQNKKENDEDKRIYEFIAIKKMELKEEKNEIEPIENLKIFKSSNLDDYQDFLQINKATKQKFTSARMRPNILENMTTSSSTQDKNKVLKIMEQKFGSTFVKEVSYKITTPEQKKDIPIMVKDGQSEILIKTPEKSTQKLLDPQKNQSRPLSNTLQKSPAFLTTEKDTSNKSLKTPEIKGSVKEMAKNLSMANLSFGPYPGSMPKIPKKTETTKTNETINDLNDIILERGVNKMRKKKKTVGKIQDFDFDSKNMRLVNSALDNKEGGEAFKKSIAILITSEENKSSSNAKGFPLNTNEESKVSDFSAKSDKITISRPIEKEEEFRGNVKINKVSEFASRFEKNSSMASNDKSKEKDKEIKVNKVSDFEKNLSSKDEPKKSLKSPVETKVSVKDLTKNLSMANLSFGRPLSEKPKTQPIFEVDKNEENDRKSVNPMTMNEGFNNEISRISEKNPSLKSKEKEKECSNNVENFKLERDSSIKTKDISAKVNKVSDFTLNFEKNLSFKNTDKEKEICSLEKNPSIKTQESNKNLMPPVETKISVKELTKNLSMVNLPFRNYPGSMDKQKPPLSPSIDENIENEKQSEKKEMNDAFNDVL